MKNEEEAMSSRGLYHEKIERPYRRSMLKWGIFIGVGCLIYPFSRAAGAFVGFGALGVLFALASYYRILKKQVRRGFIRENQGSCTIQTDDGLEIHIPSGHKSLRLLHGEDGRVSEAFLSVGGVYCGATKERSDQDGEVGRGRKEGERVDSSDGSAERSGGSKLGGKN